MCGTRFNSVINIASLLTLPLSLRLHDCCKCVVRQMSLYAEVVAVAVAGGRYREPVIISSRAVADTRSEPTGQPLKPSANTILRSSSTLNTRSAVATMVTSLMTKARPMLRSTLSDVLRRRLADGARASTRMCSVVAACVERRQRDGVHVVAIHSFPVANRRLSEVIERKLKWTRRVTAWACRW